MWNVIGHEPIVAQLQRLVLEDRMPHAVLLTGPVGVGKGHLAREIARALNCTGDNPPCGQCVHCRQVESGTHPDVSVVERADGKESISIQQMRDLREFSSLRPFQGRRKVAIILGAEAMTLQAADAMLKTIEEPPAHLTVILTASDPDAVPATILSRCRAIALRRVPPGTISAALTARGASAAEAERLARLSRGSVGWALQALTEPKLAAQQEQNIEQLSGVLDLPLAGRMELIETLAADRKDRGGMRRQVEMLGLLARDLLLLSQGQPPAAAGAAARAVLQRQAERLGPDGTVHYLQRLGLTMDRIDQNVDPRLALEALLLSLP